MDEVARRLVISSKGSATLKSNREAKRSISSSSSTSGASGGSLGSSGRGKGSAKVVVGSGGGGNGVGAGTGARRTKSLAGPAAPKSSQSVKELWRRRSRNQLGLLKNAASSGSSSAHGVAETQKVTSEHDLSGSGAPRDGDEAIAEAARIEPWCVFLLNARTEVLNASVGECTSLAVPETRILAQTWDWIRELEELVVITEVEKDDGQRFVTLVEPGMLAKIGMNSRGFGVGLNFLKAEQSLDGVPVHLVLRALLECSNLAEAREVIRRSGLGKASFILEKGSIKS